MKATRLIRRDRKSAVLALECSVEELHQIEANARHAGLSLARYAALALAAGDRACDHGISVLATGAAACVRCCADRADVAKAVVSLGLRPQTGEGLTPAPRPETMNPEDWK